MKGSHGSFSWSAICCGLFLVEKWEKKRQPQNSSASAQPKAPTAEVPNKPLIYSQPRVGRPVRSHGQPMRFAQPGRVGELFSYGGPSSGRGYSHDGPFAVIDVETTGFSPAKGDRVIELAIARVDKNGRIEDEYATLLNPEVVTRVQFLSMASAMMLSRMRRFPRKSCRRSWRV